MSERWVEECAEDMVRKSECNVSKTFEVLVRLIGQAIEDIDKVDKAYRAAGTWQFSSEERDEFPVWHIELHSPDRIDRKFRVTHNAREVTIFPLRNEAEVREQRIDIRPYWDRENAQCLLSVIKSNRTQNPIYHRDLWSVVQGLLKPLFFPDL